MTIALLPNAYTSDELFFFGMGTEPSSKNQDQPDIATGRSGPMAICRNQDSRFIVNMTGVTVEDMLENPARELAVFEFKVEGDTIRIARNGGLLSSGAMIAKRMKLVPVSPYKD